MGVRKHYDRAAAMLDIPITSPYSDIFVAESLRPSKTIMKTNKIYKFYFTDLRIRADFYGDKKSSDCPQELKIPSKARFRQDLKLLIPHLRGRDKVTGQKGWFVQVINTRLLRSQDRENATQTSTDPVFKVVDTGSKKGLAAHATRNLDKGDLVSVYDGEIVIAQVSNAREKVYEDLNYPVTRVLLERGEYLDANRNPKGVPFLPHHKLTVGEPSGVV